MMTPQEVASHSFSRAAFGGYNLAMVDEFLDSLTEDYTALYNDNAILKNKLKVLSDTVEEYRATDTAMRKTLLAAQQMADNMVQEAEQMKAKLVGEAERTATARIQQLREEIAAEEFRLKQAQEHTAAYVKQLREMHQQQVDFLDGLQELVPPEAPPQEEDPSKEIEANVHALYQKEEQEEQQKQQQQQQQQPAASQASQDPEPQEKQPAAKSAASGKGSNKGPVEGEDGTRRFEGLKFGTEYHIN